MNATEARALTDAARNDESFIDSLVQEVIDKIEERATQGFETCDLPMNHFDAVAEGISQKVFSRLRELGYSIKVKATSWVISW